MLLRLGRTPLSRAAPLALRPSVALLRGGRGLSTEPPKVPDNFYHGSFDVDVPTRDALLL